jgi:hypothetical protein
VAVLLLALHVRCELVTEAEDVLLLLLLLVQQRVPAVLLLLRVCLVSSSVELDAPACCCV